MSRVTSWIGPGKTINHATLSVAAPLLATDGIAIAEWGGHFSTGTIIHIEKTAAQTAVIWALKENGNWSIIDDIVWTENENESELVTAICRFPRLYMQLSNIAVVTRIDFEFLS